MRYVFTLSLLALAVQAVGGPNADAKLYFDFNGVSSSIDSVATCPAESTITAAVVIRDASRLYDYQLYVRYDTARLRFVSALKGNGALANLLESAGGNVVFTAKKSMYDSCRILAGCSILGDDPSQCPSGDGILCLFSFKKRTSDTTVISIESPLCEDYDQTADSAMRCHPGRIVPGEYTSIAWARPKTASAVFERGNGTVRFRFPASVDYTMTVADPLGRTMFVRGGRSDNVGFDSRNMGRPAAGSKVVFVRVRYPGEELVVPMLLRRYE